MRFTSPMLSRSNSVGSNTTPRPSTDSEETLYHVDSMIFESVNIPRTTPPPQIRISLATTASRNYRDSDATLSDATTLYRESSIMSLPLQSTLCDDENINEKTTRWAGPPPMVFDGLTLHNNSTTTLGTCTDVENGVSPSKSRSTLARTLFFLGFLFPLFWAFGGALIWRRSDFANTDLSPNTKSNTSTFEKTKTTRKERRQGVIGHKANATLKTTTTVSVHLPYADDRWAWACLWAFALFLVAVSVTMLALYSMQII